MHMWLIVLLILQFLIVTGMLVYFICSDSWDEDVKHTVLDEEEDPEVLPNPYRKVWQEYLSSR
ncbi:hypothetical protein [Effusibacillus lacus]|uniref:Uncharacterized protein n=1 Tax=Effusibacillus lacus TaxID=1348429 RepID=A0A292YFB5_9BACL|nr:hypothetical protein [Effusibacillus lacus]TCS74821.1 hypothetical protein EDD64_111111 [Effusibacillus lacus]GAX88627.1 hypothetical protein EFBL_0239 [Effusibacillus lacus]